MSEINEDSLMIVGESAPVSRGRPRVQQPLTPMTIWISPDRYDRMTQLAVLHDTSVSALGRKIVERAIDRSIE